MLPEQKPVTTRSWDEVFRASPYFREASEEALERLLAGAIIERCHRGQILFAEGTQSNQMLVVLEGSVRHVHYELSGHVAVFEVAEPGEPLGAVSSLGSAPFEGDVEASDNTVVAWVPISALEALIRAEPDVAMAVLRNIAARWVRLIAGTKRNAASVPARLARYLGELPRRQLGEHSFTVEIPGKRVELAAVLATVPETLSRAFRKLRDEGVIKDRGRKVIVLDDRRLHSIDGDACEL